LALLAKVRRSLACPNDLTALLDDLRARSS
jgi:hypothetical protein